MLTTLADPRLMLWERRKIESDRLALFRVYRASICGCTTCHDDDKAEELDALIKRQLEAIAELNDQICQ